MSDMFWNIFEVIQECVDPIGPRCMHLMTFLSISTARDRERQSDPPREPLPALRAGPERRHCQAQGGRDRHRLPGDKGQGQVSSQEEVWQVSNTNSQII